MPKKSSKSNKSSKPAFEDKSDKPHDEKQGTRRVTIRFKGGEYPGLVDADGEFLGLLCARPRGAPEDWDRAVAEAVK